MGHIKNKFQKECKTELSERGQGGERVRNRKGFLEMLSSIHQEAIGPLGLSVSTAGRCCVGGQPAIYLCRGQPDSSTVVKQWVSPSDSESGRLPLSRPVCFQSASKLGCYYDGQLASQCFTHRCQAVSWLLLSQHNCQSVGGPAACGCEH